MANLLATPGARSLETFGIPSQFRIHLTHYRHLPHPLPKTACRLDKAGRSGATFYNRPCQETQTTASGGASSHDAVGSSFGAGIGDSPSPPCKIARYRATAVVINIDPS